MIDFWVWDWNLAQMDFIQPSLCMFRILFWSGFQIVGYGMSKPKGSISRGGRPLVISLIFIILLYLLLGGIGHSFLGVVFFLQLAIMGWWKKWSLRHIPDFMRWWFFLFSSVSTVLYMPISTSQHAHGFCAWKMKETEWASDIPWVEIGAWGWAGATNEKLAFSPYSGFRSLTDL